MTKSATRHLSKKVRQEPMHWIWVRMVSVDPEVSKTNIICKSS